VLDLSTTGFAAAEPPGLALAPGSVLDSFELRIGERVIWSGESLVVHASGGRLGGRFTSGIVDLQQLRIGATLEQRLATLREQQARLPAEWRAAVADLRQLLEEVRREVEHLERTDMRPWDRDEETQLLRGLRARWANVYVDAITRLHEMSKTLDDRAAALGRQYASSMLMPILAACPLQRRAYEKPLGYAGDYRMMELCMGQELTSDGLFARFLYSIALDDYTLVRTVRSREVVMRDAIRGALAIPGADPARVLAMAAGPAVELRRLLEETHELPRPAHFILLDQDAAAHETAHRHLTRVLLERHGGMLPVTVRCLRFSVCQMLKPKTWEDEHVVYQELADLDLIYSAGLYDYLPDLVAASLTKLLYGRLRAGGRLLLGNLVETPDSTWVMDYVLGWHLRYRTEDAMLRMAETLWPRPTQATIVRDATGRCLFLDVRKPA